MFSRKKNFISTLNVESLCPTSEDFLQEEAKLEKEKLKNERKKAAKEKENQPPEALSLAYLNLKTANSKPKLKPENNKKLQVLEKSLNSSKPSKPKLALKPEKMKHSNRKFQSGILLAYNPKSFTNTLYQDDRLKPKNATSSSIKREANMSQTLANTASSLKRQKIELEAKIAENQIEVANKLSEKAKIEKENKDKNKQGKKGSKNSSGHGAATSAAADFELPEIQDFEQFIKTLLARPYKPPLPGFIPPKRRLKNLGMRGVVSNIRRPLHDPYAEKALILYEPPFMSHDEYMRADKTKLLVHVVVDPLLGNVLRPHQREGVKFMYDCVAEGIEFEPLQLNLKPIKGGRGKKKKNAVVEPIAEETGSSSTPKKSVLISSSESDSNSPENQKSLTVATQKRRDSGFFKRLHPKLYPDYVEAAPVIETSPDDPEAATKPQKIIGHGCILADDMGLGKTLQCVALIFTLVKQSKEMTPLVEKCIVISPSSLVKNWANEVKKWLKSRVQTLAIETGAVSREVVRKQMQTFMDQVRHTVPVMFISYETLRGHADIVGNSEIGLIICDEGHRLKNSENQTYQALNNLNCRRRVLLSGTPIQNDLLEYYF